MTDKTSLSLLDRVRGLSDAESWHRLHDLYAPMLRSWLRKYHVQDADADDLIQDVLSTVSKELPLFEHNQRTGAFRTWLRQILVNRLRDFWRSRQYRPATPGGSSVIDELQQLADDRSQVSQLWNQQHDEFVVSRLMEAVRPKFQAQTWEIFRRLMLDELNADEVASALGVPLPKVYVAKSRVLNALRHEANGLVDSF